MNPPALLGILPYIKRKTYKTSSNSRVEGKVEIHPKLLNPSRFGPGKFSKTGPAGGGGIGKTGPPSESLPGFYTGSTGTPQRG